MRKPRRVQPAIAAYALCILSVGAHSGRTDSQGGHHDRRNGGYHFHHGMGSHQHPGGACPYRHDTIRQVSPQVNPRRETESFIESHPLMSLIGAWFLGALTWEYYRKRKRGGVRASALRTGVFTEGRG